jgi:hypothetical protein
MESLHKWNTKPLTFGYVLNLIICIRLDTVIYFSEISEARKPIVTFYKVIFDSINMEPRKNRDMFI